VAKYANYLCPDTQQMLNPNPNPNPKPDLNRNINPNVSTVAPVTVNTQSAPSAHRRASEQLPPLLLSSRSSEGLGLGVVMHCLRLQVAIPKVRYPQREITN